MAQNFFITNSENQNHNASTSAQRCGGVVLVLSATFVHEAASVTADNNSVSAGVDMGNTVIWTVKIAEWRTNEENQNLSYSDSEIEHDFTQIDILYLLSPGVYAVSFPDSVSSQDEKAVLSYIVNIFRKHGHFATTVTEGSITNNSKTGGGDS